MDYRLGQEGIVRDRVSDQVSYADLEKNDSEFFRKIFL